MHAHRTSKQMAVVFAAVCSAQAKGSCWNVLPVARVKGFNVRIGRKKFFSPSWADVSGQF